MKTKILFPLISIIFFLSSCEDPLPHENSSFVYIPFSFRTDTLNNIETIQYVPNEIEWDSHLRAWVGETRFYKSGFAVEIDFADTNLDFSNIENIQFSLRHQMTFPENGGDTLINEYAIFDFYETDGQQIDMNNAASFGTLLGSDSMNVKGGNDIWSFTLPDGIIATGDSSIGLGIYPQEQGLLSAIYGAGTTIRPVLIFNFKEPDTTGGDSITFLSYSADTLYLDLVEKPSAFNRSDQNYLSQLSNDSLLYTLNLEGLKPEGDTLMHVASSSFLPGILPDSSELYFSSSADSLQRFGVRLTDATTLFSVDVEVLANSFSFPNEINYMIQAALDDERTELELIMQPLLPGYGPGFIAFSTAENQSTLSLSTSMGVRP